MQRREQPHVTGGGAGRSLSKGRLPRREQRGAPAATDQVVDVRAGRQRVQPVAIAEHAVPTWRRTSRPSPGYNGGPLRMPTQRIHDHQMAALRKGLLDAGLTPSMDPFREFFTGRNPA